MYKLLYKVIGTEPSVFAFWGEKNEDGSFTEYAYDKEVEVKEAGRRLAKIVGTDDIRIVLDNDYYLKIIMGERPEPIIDTFDVQLSSSTDVVIEPDSFENVASGSTISATLTFKAPVEQFHLLVDGEETSLGLLDWIKYSSISDTEGKLTLTNINANHTIVIIVDKIKEEIRPSV